MLAPLRDYLSPKDPKLSPLLCEAKECYFTRLSTELDPDQPNFDETRWIKSEDVNAEHLLNVFTTIDPNSDIVWNACIKFLDHLYWHKRRPTVLESKIEALPDDHHWKPTGLLYLASEEIRAHGNLGSLRYFSSYPAQMDLHANPRKR